VISWLQNDLLRSQEEGGRNPLNRRVKRFSEMKEAVSFLLRKAKGGILTDTPASHVQEAQPKKKRGYCGFLWAYRL
jgi:hypothetical protein